MPFKCSEGLLKEKPKSELAETYFYPEIES